MKLKILTVEYGYSSYTRKVIAWLVDFTQPGVSIESTGENRIQLL